MAVTKIKLVKPDDDSVEYDGEPDELEGTINIKDDKIDQHSDAYFIYCGRLVSKNHFRAFIYGKEGQKLVNSYREFAQEMASGLWFESVEAYEASLLAPLATKRRKKVKIKEEQLDLAPVEPEEDASHEVIEYGTDR